MQYYSIVSIVGRPGAVDAAVHPQLPGATSARFHCLGGLLHTVNKSKTGDNLSPPPFIPSRSYRIVL
jgi:hypothetical protein